MDKLLTNRYEIVNPLGSGGFGETFLARDTQLPSQSLVVVKRLKPINSDNHTAYDLIEKLFEKEAKVLEDLGRNSSQIPSLLSYFVHHDQFYLVQEYIEGKNLAQVGIIGSEQAIIILTSLLNTLKYIHNKNIIHRDIKPENIILRNSDHLPVLIDFGAVKETMGAATLGSGSIVSSVVVGTRGFMAPEQSSGRAVFSTDLYALGLTMIYAITGKLPIEMSIHPATGELEWESYAPNVEPRLRTVLSKVVKMEIASRYATAEEMNQALHISSTRFSTNFSNSQTLTFAPASPTPTVIIPSSSYSTSNSPTDSKSSFPWSKLILILLTAVVVALGVSASFLIMQQIKEAEQKLADSEKQKEDVQKALAEEEKKRQEAESLRAEAEKNRLAAERMRREAEKKAAAAPKTIVRRIIVNPSSGSSGGTYATIGGRPGTKNIRSGPGTDYGVVGTGLTGQPIEILGRDYDRSGYLWYQVYHPSSGITGWIAGQLVDL
ncbi:serine/threonine protein kinase [Umezakia ovalisporum]|uniref:non-specific serine/threonine protein kinase n=2 Tax=Umezakia ovalisporum TaxID=75695 RepID=A0AA43GZN5_9CYAN|nr:serine/threonine protein kinase [Umezakia ovalisporum]MBI1241864.1 protein kinase [Nostoc sp. RI_552]MDH6055423.1 protein kinase [Umezakia ovalisporum FSS-43]MDH6064157.1 protein kinase [Umezakia ovalisporum FSS-62]MDH6068504.1 protein kinase [Umezakia ovalisporum APH033B]MDH6069965.1 protein kinase [Umezakia ovalisporum CobakiLakeA]